VKWRRGLGGKSLAVEEREIGAILILQLVLAALEENTCVQARYASLFTTMWGQVNVREDIAHGVFASDDDIIFSTQVKFLVIALND
jgi:hypothetical protein